MNEKKYIALTFDDGPDNETTPQVLDLLEKYGAKGSFFLIGQNITPETEHIVRRERSLGFEINAHSLTHSDMTKLSDDEIISETAETDQRIFDITGEHPHFFRPPYILYNENMFKLIDRPFICGHGCEDWEPSVDTEERITRILECAHDGAIILLHDFGGNQQTVDALKVVIPELISRGFELCTITELFSAHGIEPVAGADRQIIYSDVFQAES